MIRYLSIIIILTLYKLKSQDFQFVHYPYTPTKVNPAMTAMEPKASLSVLHRNQPRPGLNATQSSIATAVYPIVVKPPQKQLGAIALSAQDDRWAGIVPYKNQNITCNFATMVKLESHHQLSFGMQTALHRKSIDLTDAITGSQYSDLLGYDGSIANGEPMGMLTTSFITLSSGIYWQHLDATKSVKNAAGFSLFNMTLRNQSFIKSRPGPLGFAMHMNPRLWSNDQIIIAAELLWSRFNTSHLLSLGGKLSYLLDMGTSEKHIDLYIRHVLGKSSNVSIVFDQPKLTIGIGSEMVHYSNKEAQIRPAMELLLAYKLRPHIFNKRNSKGNAETENVETPKKKIPIKRKKKGKIRSRSKKKVTSSLRKNSTNNSSNKQRKQPPLVVDQKLQNQDSLAITPSDTVVAQHHISPPKDTLELADSKRRATDVFAHKMLKNLEFEFKSTALTSKSQEHLKDFAKLLTEAPEQKIKIIGHSDNIGDAQSNLRISELRANVVKSYLIDMGIDASRISTEGQGSNEPLYPNDTELGRSKNRRVEFQFYE